MLSILLTSTIVEFFTRIRDLPGAGHSSRAVAGPLAHRPCRPVPLGLCPLFRLFPSDSSAASCSSRPLLSLPRIPRSVALFPPVPAPFPHAQQFILRALPRGGTSLSVAKGVVCGTSGPGRPRSGSVRVLHIWSSRLSSLSGIGSHKSAIPPAQGAAQRQLRSTMSKTSMLDARRLFGTLICETGIRDRPTLRSGASPWRRGLVPRMQRIPRHGLVHLGHRKTETLDWRSESR